jgi:hypothetical protein
MKKRYAGGTAVALLLALAAGCGEDSTGTDLETEFDATLTGAAERPNPVTTTATGTASVEIDDAAQTITVTVSVSNIVSVTMAHIHVGDANTAGPIALTLVGTALPVGSFTGTLVNDQTFAASAISGGETFATLAAKIRAGNAYINVHTVANGAGEIRGQLVAD